MTIHQAFAKQARLQPQATAVICEEARITYGDLDLQSTELARRIIRAGVRRGDRVGVSLPPSTGMVIAMLAVMKSGAAYVPLDPEYPVARLQFIARDTNISALISNQSLLPEFDAITLHPEEYSDCSSIPLPEVPYNSIAYVIYTSGSTGRPKGVLIPHQNVIALLRATSEEFKLGPADTWSGFHSFAFDFSVWEIWGSLLTGGQLVMVPRWTARDPDEFFGLLMRSQITVLSQTPSAFTQLLPATRADKGSLSVRLLIFGGELLDPRILGDWFEQYPNCRAENMYGITETTVHSTSRTLSPADLASGSRSVGRALPGWRVYVADSTGSPAPAGEAGEIYVAGAGVAAGYLGLPGLTAQRFVPDQAGLTAGSRVYRSGDLGRMNQDGELECLGRIDDQVKIRGHRIELGEIRAALQQFPTVKAAAVVARSGAAAGDVALDAYVAAPGGQDLPAALRDFLLARLPHYMIPATITRVDQLPLTPNGKLDITALPCPGSTEQEVRTARTDYSLPELAQLWFDLLGIWPDPQDSFFELGGNSVLVTKLRAAIRLSGRADLPIIALYRNSTLAAMSDLVAHSKPPNHIS